MDGDRAILGLIGAGALGVVLLVGGCATFGDVAVGYNGVEECASSLTGKVVSEGWHTKAAWCRFDTISIGNNQFKADQDQAVTKDQQSVATSVNVTWTVNPAHLVDIQRKYHGDLADVVLAPNVAQAVKQGASQFTATELTTQRARVQDSMERVLRQRLAPYNNDLDVVQLSITNFEFSKAWQEAVEAKVIAGQTLLTEQTNLQTERVKAQQAVAQARGAAASQQAQRLTLNPLLIQKQWIEKWNGVLPTVTGGSNMLSMGSPFASEGKGQ